VLHRLFDPGSDRAAAERWKQDFVIEGAQRIELHQLYRAMGWLGEEMERPSGGGSWLGSRYTKDRIEELLFARRRDLFSSLQVLFFDTTSIYFEGEGGESIGQLGHSKDRRPDLKQIVVGVALDEEGRPVCCELLPGNVADVQLFFPLIKGMKARFEAGSFCVVADRGMISKKTLSAFEARGSGIDYIIGCRMRRQKEVRDGVVGRRGGRYEEVRFDRKASGEPLVLKVKEVKIEDRRYIVCLNPEQAKKDAADRKAIVESLRERLKRGDKALVGNKGYRKYLKSDTDQGRFSIDEGKLKEEARLWMVEQAFRSLKSILETRPIYHKCDDTIRGHVFCSFLALLLMKELFSRLEAKGKSFEWGQIKGDLQALREVELDVDGDGYRLRTELRGSCFDVLGAAGVAVPPTLRR
jgi:hypothetical protein